MMEKTLTMVEEDLDGFTGEACLVKDQDGNYFVISTVTAGQAPHFCQRVETMAFRADQDGNITDWLEVAGGAEMTRSDVLETLAKGEFVSNVSTFVETEFDSEWYPEDDWEDWHRDDESLSEYDQSTWIYD